MNAKLNARLPRAQEGCNPRRSPSLTTRSARDVCAKLVFKGMSETAHPRSTTQCDCHLFSNWPNKGSSPFYKRRYTNSGIIALWPRQDRCGLSLLRVLNVRVCLTCFKALPAGLIRSRFCSAILSCCEDATIWRYELTAARNQLCSPRSVYFSWASYSVSCFFSI